jgi:KDO2-lipid IV(A) lauroyltransferase
VKALAGGVFSTSADALPESAARPPAPPRQWTTRLRRAAAAFWLARFFWLSERVPGLLRRGGPLLCRMAFRASPALSVGPLANARRILGPAAPDRDVRRLAGAVLGHFYLFCLDVGRGGRASAERALDEIDGVDGHDLYLAARAMRKGAIVVTAHMGSFEVGMAALRRHEPRIHVVFRRDSDGEFERQRARLRNRLGIIEAPVDDGWTVWLRLRDALLADEVVVVQGDRVMPGQKGQKVPFLGGHVMLPSGPVKLALASGAPIVPVFTARLPSGKIRLFIEPAIVVTPATQALGEPHSALLQLAGVLEKYVRAYPEQWLVLQAAWCEDASP